MKYILFFLIEGIVSVAIAQHTLQPKYKVGDTLSCGAIVFSVQNDSAKKVQRVLICSTVDVPNGQTPWYNGTYLTVGSTRDGLFDMANASLIVQKLGFTGKYAALLCKGYHPPTFCPDTTWYLPSKAELSLMYTNVALKGMGGFAKEGYWSSVEASATVGDSLNVKAVRKAWIVDFIDGHRFPVDKANKYHVRPVMAFRIAYQ
jgi:hypothetical protein